MNNNSAVLGQKGESIIKSDAQLLLRASPETETVHPICLKLIWTILYLVLFLVISLHSIPFSYPC